MTTTAERAAGTPIEEDDGAPLPWATWLRISTRRLKRDPEERAAALAAEEIEAKQWSLADRYWNLVIAEKIGEGDHTLSDRYAAACVRELAARKEAVPAQAPAPLPAVEPPSPPPAAPSPVETPLDLGTAIGAIPGVPALPFASSAPSGDPVERAKQHASRAQPAPAPRAPIGETEAVDVAALARRVLAFGPPKAAGAPAIPVLTVEQYASLCVDLELAPRSPADVLRRYGVTPEAKRTLDDGWSRVFAEQPARRAAFEHAKATYRAWLTRGGR
jgi:hypothetical protein